MVKADYDKMITDLKLELVAGNVIKVPYSGKATDEQICKFTKCANNFPEVNGFEEGGANCPSA